MVSTEGSGKPVPEGQRHVRPATAPHSLFLRDHDPSSPEGAEHGLPPMGSPPDATRSLCPLCQMHDHAERSARFCSGQRMMSRSQEPSTEKPPSALRCGGSVSQETGGTRSQNAICHNLHGPAPGNALDG